MTGGYMGKVLWVDLTKGEFREEAIPEEVYRNYLSGYGLAAKMIFDNQAGGVDPLGPEAILGFASGMLTGTGSVFTGRWMVVGKSPLTGGWGDANCGGNFAPALKKTGYDSIFFTGQSEKPVYLLMEGSKKELVEAEDYWGTDAIETEKQLIEKHGKAFKVACIGQGGENQSLIAGVVNDRGRIAARSGLGAVMGSKKLKALCIKGTAKVPVHDRKQITALTKDYVRRLERDKFADKIFHGKLLALLGRLQSHMGAQPAMMGELFKITTRIWGTPSLSAMSAENGDSPVKNWKGVGREDFPSFSKASKIGDDAVIKFQKKRYHCFSCPLGCGGVCAVDDPRFPLEETHKPEYESLCALGTMLLIDDLGALYKVNDDLNRAGLDTISVGGTIAWAFEAYERGHLTKNDTDGLELTWGNSEAMVALVGKIIRQDEGIGQLLKNGVKVASETLGEHTKEYAIHAGGQELPMHDPRADAGYGIAYESEPTPGRHTIASYIYADLMNLSQKTDLMPKRALLHSLSERLGLKGKGRQQGLVSAYTDVINGIGMCLFGACFGSNPPVAEWINAATGWNYSFNEYLEIGKRIKTIRQAFNSREGIQPKQQKMTDRARGVPPLKSGPLKNMSPDFDNLNASYYEEMGWNHQDGKPLPQTLDRLNMQDVKEQLYKD